MKVNAGFFIKQVYTLWQHK